MYWTNVVGNVMKAKMDGSDVTVVVSDLQFPMGIAVDYDASLLYWTDYNANRIQSSNTAGGDIRGLVQLPASTGPWGLALHGNKLY